MAITVTHAKTVNIADDPKAAAAGEVLPSDWNAVHVVTGASGRTILTMDTSFFVSATGSDSNGGTDPVTDAWATLQHAMDFISSSLDIAGFTITVNIGAGSFAGLGLKDPVGGGIIQFNGAGSASTTLTDGPADGVFNTGEVISVYVPIPNVVFGFNKVTIAGTTNNPSGACIQTFAIAFIHLGDAPTTANADIIIVFDVSGATPSIALNNLALLQFDPGATTLDFTPANSTLTQYVFFLSSLATVNLATTFTITGNPTYQIPGPAPFIWGFSNAIVLDDGGFTSWSGTASGPVLLLQAGSDSKLSKTIPGSFGTIDASCSFNGQNGPLPGINTQTTNYTLAIGDVSGTVEMNLAGANTVTVPSNATVAFPVGTKIKVTQVGAGATTIAGAGGVTVDNAGVVGGQWKSALLYKRGTDEWVQTT